MPRYDQRCLRCPWLAEIWAQPYEQPPCPSCGGPTERLWIVSAGVRDDSWPSGKTFENLAHDPVTFYSRSEYRRFLDATGQQEFVRHVGTPGEGSDKSKETTRWI